MHCHGAQGCMTIRYMFRHHLTQVTTACKVILQSHNVTVTRAKIFKCEHTAVTFPSSLESDHSEVEQTTNSHPVVSKPNCCDQTTFLRRHTLPQDADMREETISATTDLEAPIFVQWHNIGQFSAASAATFAAKGGFSVAHTTSYKSYADLMHSIAEDVREDLYRVVHVSSGPGTVMISCQSHKPFSEFAAARMKRWRILTCGRFDEHLLLEDSESMSTWLA